MSSYIKKCRNCNSKSLKPLFSLGKIKFTGKFPKFKENIPNGELELVICKKCKLVQLKHIFNMKYLYNKDYGYRTGINATMSNHVKNVVRKISKVARLKKGDNVLDIASNDATLLKNYKGSIITWGIDPVLFKYKKEYKKINYKIPNFFKYNLINSKKKNAKFKIISALSVFYDLQNPNIFLSDIKKILHKDGIFYLEFQDLLKILQMNMFDTICHEHLEYYSVTFINNLLKKHNLRIFEHYYNDINGGSSAYLICHDKSRFQTNFKKINNILSKENKYGVGKISTYTKFKKRIDKLKKQLNLKIDKILKEGKSIHGYAASTKGNVLLQYYNLNHKKIDYISDRNPKKSNLFTPGSNIKIISENKSRSMNPNYYLVLAWHFKKEILKRETKARDKGTKFIFPLPKFEIV